MNVCLGPIGGGHDDRADDPRQQDGNQGARGRGQLQTQII